MVTSSSIYADSFMAKRGKASPETINELRRQRSEGASLRLLEERFGMSLGSVRYHTQDIVIDKPRFTRSRPQGQVFKPLRPSKRLAFLLGIVIGDGFIEVQPRCFCLWISLHKDQTYLVEETRRLIEDLTGLTPSVSPRKKSRCIDVRVWSQGLPLLLGFPPGRKSSFRWKLPDWILGDVRYLEALARGLFETDGSYHTVLDGKRFFTQLGFVAKHTWVRKIFIEVMDRMGYRFKESSPGRFLLSRTNHAKALRDRVELIKNAHYKRMKH